MRRLLGITGLVPLQFPLMKGGVRGLFSPPKVRANSRPANGRCSSNGAGGWVGLCFAIALLFCGTAVILSLSKDALAFQLPDTGQMKCYQGVSPYAEIPCAGTGQDGAYDINPMSYTNNGNGTVTDNNTGLIWQQQDDGNVYNWYQASGTYDAAYNPTAINVCGALGADWRLPTKKELMSIVDYSIPYPGPTINTIFTNTKQSTYWSSTTYANDPDFAWYVYFSNGYVDSYYKSVSYYVRCVRAGQ